jgi:translocation and assembly module TamB
LRGSYNLYGNKFQITEGTFDFSASEALRPSIQIDAYTPYHGAEESTERNIYLSLAWPYDQKEPRIQLAYDEPGYSESDIWRMLGRNNLAAGMASSALERVISEQMTGFTVDVQQRAVEDGSTGEMETSIGVGKYLWEDVYLQYRRGLSIESEQEVNVEYRLRNRLLLRSQVIYNSRRHNSGIKGKNTDEYNLDLKYRFEF